MPTCEQPRFRKSMSASDLVKALEADEDYQRRMRDKRRFVRKKMKDAMSAAAPVVAELRKAGFPVSGIGDLWMQGMEYRAAVPILLRWLQKTEDLRLKEGIARALATKHARPEAARPLLDEFKKLSDNKVKWVIGNALEVVADDAYFDEIVRIAKNRAHGTSRRMLVQSLGNMSDRRADAVLIPLLQDDEVMANAIYALGKRKSSRARPYLEALLAHPDSAVRTEVKRALAKIERAEQQARDKGRAI